MYVCMYVHMYVCMHTFYMHVCLAELRLGHLAFDEDEGSDLEMPDAEQAPLPPSRVLPPGPRHPGFLPLRVFRMLAVISSVSCPGVYASHGCSVYGMGHSP